VSRSRPSVRSQKLSQAPSLHLIVFDLSGRSVFFPLAFLSSPLPSPLHVPLSQVPITRSPVPQSINTSVIIHHHHSSIHPSSGPLHQHGHSFHLSVGASLQGHTRNTHTDGQRTRAARQGRGWVRTAPHEPQLFPLAGALHLGPVEKRKVRLG
jgi:hypothetical protein